MPTPPWYGCAGSFRSEVKTNTILIGKDQRGCTLALDNNIAICYKITYSNIIIKDTMEVAMTQYGTWNPYGGSNSILLAVVLFIVMGIWIYLAIRLHHSIEVKRPGKFLG